MTKEAYNWNDIRDVKQLAGPIADLTREKKIPNDVFNAAFRMAVQHVYDGSTATCAKNLEVSHNTARKWFNGAAPTAINRRVVISIISKDIQKALTL